MENKKRDEDAEWAAAYFQLSAEAREELRSLLLQKRYCQRQVWVISVRRVLQPLILGDEEQEG